jgi:predicted neutral ceramidase superfamily lipid hydrolase
MEFHIENLVNLYYILSVTVFTYLILLLVINTNKRYVKVLTSIITGSIIGFIFYHFKVATTDVLITSFLISIVGYEWIIKQILDKFNITTNNNIGIKL